MSRARQQFAVLMLAHFFPALFYDTPQSITPFPEKIIYKVTGKKTIKKQFFSTCFFKKVVS